MKMIITEKAIEKAITKIKSLSAEQLGCSAFALRVFKNLNDEHNLSVRLAAAGDKNITEWFMKEIARKDTNLHKTCNCEASLTILTAILIAKKANNTNTAEALQDILDSLVDYKKSGEESYFVDAVNGLESITVEPDYEPFIKTALVELKLGYK